MSFGISVKLAVKIMKQEPMIMKKRAGRSYLQMKTSFKKMRARKTWIRIAVAELNESSTMSANGVAAKRPSKNSY